jgi:hypothetical protein
MVSRCDICGFEAKTSQGLAGHRRLLHAPVSATLQPQTSVSSSDVPPNHELENHPDTASTEEMLARIENRLTELEARIETLWDSTRILVADMEERARNLVSGAKASTMQLAQEQVSKELDRRLGPVERCLIDLTSIVATAATMAARLELRMGEVEACTGIRCRSTIHRDIQSGIPHKTSLCFNSTGRHSHLPKSQPRT